MEVMRVAEQVEAHADEELEQATELLGTPEAVFRANGRRQRASIWLGIGLIVYSILANYVWWVHVRGGFGHIEFHLLVMPLVLGIGLLAFVYHHRGLRVAVFSTGVLRLRPDEVESVPFDEVQVLRLRTAAAVPVFERDVDTGEIVTCYLPLLVPTFRIWDVWVELERSNEEKSKFRAAVHDFPALAELVQRKVFAKLWPATLEQIRSGGTVMFDTLGVSSAGLRAGEKTLPWSEFKEIKLVGGIVSISRMSGWRAFWAHEISTIPSPQLLFAVVDVLQPPSPPTEV